MFFDCLDKSFMHLAHSRSRGTNMNMNISVYLKDSCERAPRGFLVAVERQAADDDDRAGEHHERSEREAEAPALVLLHPHQEYEPHEPSERDAEGEPVEEAHLAAQLRRVVAVELVAAQRRRA